ncbi:hypothetical protein V8E53_002092 [Lactarius tabidus]
MTTAQPCQEDCTFIQDLPVPLTLGKNNQPIHDWTPFEDHLAFDWAHYHYVSLHSLATKITEGLNLWSAMAFKHSSSTGAPWKTVKDMYKMIDAIQIGSLLFKTHCLFYKGPKLSTPLRWMEEVYELDARNFLAIIQDQLAMSNFKGQFDYVPYQEFNNKGEHIWSNLMSLQWAFKQADELSQDQKNHRAMFVPIIARSNKTTQKHPEFQRFCWQLDHSCLKLIFKLLREFMMTYTTVKCADRQFHHTIFGLGPYIVDYPEQVWLGGIRCNALPENMVTRVGYRWMHEKTDYLVKKFDSRTVWDSFGIYEDVVPLTHSFPQANIHKLLAPDLLHQVIKGIFKDHLILWVGLYLECVHSKACHHLSYSFLLRISIVPSFPGLQWFPDGHNFTQWTGNRAIAEYLPSVLVHCISTFMDTCYITLQNAISASLCHELCEAFITCAFNHYYYLIQSFGSPNGLCSSITELKYIKVVKDTWHWSSCFRAITQIMVTLLQLHKLAAACQHFTLLSMLKGTTTTYVVGVMNREDPQEDLTPQNGYPGDIQDLTASVQQPDLPLALQKFLFLFRNPDSISTHPSLPNLPQFHSCVNIHYLALTTFFVPSNLRGICSTLSWYNHPHHNTIFVVLDDTLPGMEGMVITCIQLLLLFNYSGIDHHCTLVNWLVCKDDEPDPDTGMWIVSLEKWNRVLMTQVIDVKTIVGAAHLLLVFGQDTVPSDIHHYNSLDRYQFFFVNKYADHHSHELLTDHYQ